MRISNKLGILFIILEASHVTGSFYCQQCRDADVCETVVGTLRYTVMSKGYHPVVTMPRGACYINVTEAGRTSNLIAIKDGNGYIINGNWKTDPSGQYNAVGTTFIYRKAEEPCLGECITADGPTLGKVVIQLLYHERNPGIYYSYQVARGLKDLPDDPRIKANDRSELREAAIGYRNIPDHSETESKPGSFPEFVPIPGGSGIHLKGPVFSSDFSYRQKSNSRRSRHRNDRRGGNTENRQALKDVTFVRGETDDTFRQVGGPEGGNVKISSGKDPLLAVDSGDGLASVLEVFSWRLTGYTECTRDCGGGMQESLYECVDAYSLQTTAPLRCADVLRPEARHRVCNPEPCTPSWSTGTWSKCSVTCGHGKKSREVSCVQRISATDSQLIADSYCTSSKPTSVHDCFSDSCFYWSAGNWSECSVDCGNGTRTRHVTCQDETGNIANSNQCNSQSEPLSEESCDRGACAGTQWYFSQWNDKCNENCGRGVATRTVHCATSAGHILADRFCDVSSRPESERKCDQEGRCVAQWFTGPWGKCSQACGPGVKTRDVLCISTREGVRAIATETECKDEDKPETTKPCTESTCGTEWYRSDWSQCSKSCGGGIQTRAVRCMGGDSRTRSTCHESDKPRDNRVCNTDPCRSAQTLARRGCTDEYPSCDVVVQANLCRYPYYQRKCCQSCTGSTRI